MRAVLFSPAGRTLRFVDAILLGAATGAAQRRDGDKVSIAAEDFLQIRKRLDAVRDEGTAIYRVRDERQARECTRKKAGGLARTRRCSPPPYEASGYN